MVVIVIPPKFVQFGIISRYLHRIGGLGMYSASEKVFLDTSACVLSFFFNSLWDTSFISLMLYNLKSDEDVTVLFSFVKVESAI